MIETDQFISYRVEEIGNGLPVHLITCRAWHLATIAVLINFGSATSSWHFGKNSIHRFPQGMAHFMEHLLMFVNKKKWSQIASSYGSSVNGLVSEDHTILYANRCLLDNDNIADSISDIVYKLIYSLVALNHSDGELTKLINDTRTDVLNEIAYRHDILNYRLRLTLLKSLYVRNNVRHDPLGDRNSLDAIDTYNVRMAHDVICNSIRSVVVLSKELPDEIVASIDKKIQLLPIKENAGQTVLYLEPPFEEPEAVAKFSDGFQHTEMLGKAVVLAGLKLKPLFQAYPEPHLLCQIILINYVITNVLLHRVESLFCRHARTYMLRGIYPDPRFFWDPALIFGIAKQLREAIKNKFLTYRDYFEPWTRDSFYKIIEGRESTLKLFQNADIFGVNFNQLLDAFNQVTTQSIDAILQELYSDNTYLALAYASPCVDEL